MAYRKVKLVEIEVFTEKKIDRFPYEHFYEMRLVGYCDWLDVCPRWLLELWCFYPDYYYPDNEYYDDDIWLFRWWVYFLLAWANKKYDGTFPIRALHNDFRDVLDVPFSEAKRSVNTQGFMNNLSHVLTCQGYLTRIGSRYPNRINDNYLELCPGKPIPNIIQRLASSVHDPTGGSQR